MLTLQTLYIYTLSASLDRFNQLLLYLGMTASSARETKKTEFCKIISEFALEYRTTRERVLEQEKKKANHRKRAMTRGKMITEVCELGIPYVPLPKLLRKGWGYR